MREVAAALLFDRDGKFLIYLRDDKSEIPFPNHWDLFGGHVEAGETPQFALIRELEEELRVTPIKLEFFKSYECTVGDVYPNRKYIYLGRLAERATELTLYEGQELRGTDIQYFKDYRFANILDQIIADYLPEHLGV